MTAPHKNTDQVQVGLAQEGIPDQQKIKKKGQNKNIAEKTEKIKRREEKY